MSTEHEGEYETRVWLVRTIAVGLAATVAVAIAFVIGVLPPGGGGSDDANTNQLSLASDTTAPPSEDSDLEPGASEAAQPAEASLPPVTLADQGDTLDQDVGDNADDTITDADADDVDAESDLGGEDTTASAAASSLPTTTLGESTGQPSYPVLPDGSPIPVLGIYDGDLITLSGVVPSEEAADRLRTLALAFSKVPDAEVASFITIDPTIPINVGVRVIEMNSVRFPEGTPRISAEHALELDRVALLMTALPQVTTVVIGHADQRGDSDRNFALSADRARAALDYIVGQGIEPTRLSARGSGETDLLTLNNDDTALALNRRTEFVISGLFVDPPPAEDAPPATDPPADDE